MSTDSPDEATLATVQQRLFAPLQVGPMLLPNRLALAPLTNCQSHGNGTLSEHELRWLEMRGEGGFGLVSTCAAYVAPDGKGWAGSLGVHDDGSVPGLTQLTSTLHRHGAKAVAQLFHGGARAPQAVIGTQPWSASEFEAPGFEPHRAATHHDIERVLADFIAAALRCQVAGFDAVEIHGAHGYLLTQFLSPTFNRRTDAWGGSLENRARLLRAVVRGVAEATAGMLAILVRLSPESFGPVTGLVLEETIQVARWLMDDGAHALHLSLWNYQAASLAHPPLPVLPQVRRALGDAVPLLAAGTVWSVQDALALRAQGADVVALGRAAIFNPAWPQHARAEGIAYAPARAPFPVSRLPEVGVSPAFAAYLGERFAALLDRGSDARDGQPAAR